MGGTSVRKAYPNGSEETWAEYPKMLLHIRAPNPFGSTWGMNVDNGIHNQRTGNPDAVGIHRRGRKWYLEFEDGKGWSWI